MNNIITWDNIMEKSLSLPGAKVYREEFLIEVFEPYYKEDSLSFKEKSPLDLFDIKIIDQIAKDVTDKHLRNVTLISSAAGLPGGWGGFATIPADLAQFYWHTLVLAQKLGYIYGWADLLDDKKQITEGTKNILTLFIGVMMGANAANKAINELSKIASKEVAKRISQKALTKTSWYPIVKEVGKWIGVKISKEVAGRGISKLVPILGALTSGGLTYFSFKEMAVRLRNRLKQEIEIKY